MVSQKTDILVKIVKENKIQILFLISCIIILITHCCDLLFPTAMKYTKITSINKKDDKSEKKYYRLISIFPNLSN